MHSGTAERPPSPTLQRWFVLGLLLLFLGLSVQYSIKAMANRSAILRWRPSLHQLDDVDINQYLQPPQPQAGKPPPNK